MIVLLLYQYHFHYSNNKNKIDELHMLPNTSEMITCRLALILDSIAPQVKAEAMHPFKFAFTL